MPEATLLNLLMMDFKNILDLELETANDWIRYKKCTCSENPDIQSKRLSLDCPHLNAEIEARIKEHEKKRKIKSDVLLLRSFGRFKRAQQRFHIL